MPSPGIRIGLVGAGAIMRLSHAPTILRSDCATLVAVFDKELARAEAIAADFGGRAFDDLDAMLDLPDLEGVLGVAEDYKDHPKCLNGASDLVNTAFGERGRHTRMIYTNPVMPLDCTSLVILYAEIDA